MPAATAKSGKSAASTATATRTRKKSTAKTTRKTTTRKAPAKQPFTVALVGETPAPSIPVTEPGQFGRVNILDITPNEERGTYPGRVELGEPFTMTAQVFIEGFFCICG